MSDYVLQVWDANGDSVYDSSVDFTLSSITDVDIPASTVGAGRSFSFPDFSGLQVFAFLQSPYSSGDIYGGALQSCRVTYPGGVPTVTVFYDNPGVPLAARADGHLAVFTSGASQ